MRQMVITLVGSTKQEWQEQYRKVNRELSLYGFVVMLVGLFKTDVPNIEEHRPLLEKLYFQKINMADAVVLIDKNAVGEHTKLEIDYCTRIGKPVYEFTNEYDTVRRMLGMFPEAPEISDSDGW